MDYLIKIFDSEALVRAGGLLLVFLFVFGQTGLFFCFFLPSGGLMFTAGVFTATGVMPYSLAAICSVLTGAALLGNATGYWLGRKAGPLLYNRKDSRYFRVEHLNAARNFYKKWGGLASAGALFFPIIRTFAPMVAGSVKMKFTRFLFFSFLGSALWVSTFVLAGYLLGSIPSIKDYLGYIILAIVLLVTTPMVIGILRKLRNSGKGKLHG